MKGERHIKSRQTLRRRRRTSTAAVTPPHIVHWGSLWSPISCSLSLSGSHQTSDPHVCIVVVAPLLLLFQYFCLHLSALFLLASFSLSLAFSGILSNSSQKILLTVKCALFAPIYTSCCYYCWGWCNGSTFAFIFFLLCLDCF